MRQEIFITKQELSTLLKARLDQLPDYRESLELVKANSEGRIWLIGGIVSRILISEIYHAGQPEHDYDFLVEKLRPNLKIPDGWSVENKKHGNPTFLRGNLEVDIFPITTSDHIKQNRLSPTIDNFFKGAPFTIQALAYDIASSQLIGEVGIDALKKREYKVNNLEEARRMAESKGITVNDRIKKKAKSLGLTPILQ
ncbi:MAG: hypothetical protein V1866_06905 [archaeon]